MSISFVFSQNTSVWKKQTSILSNEIKENKKELPLNQIFELDIENIKETLQSAPKRDEFLGKSNLIISFPNVDGTLERFRIFEASVMELELQLKYPEIRSYAGQGIDDPSAIIRFSISPFGLQSMVLSANRETSFIEPLTVDNKKYAVYKRSDKNNTVNDFECKTIEAINSNLNGNITNRSADDGILRTYRLAMSTTGEYTTFHGGTVAGALAAINATMTRVNGIYETDFNVTMVLIANTNLVIYTDAGTDPYSTQANYNGELQSTLTAIIGEANYDIGHLVGGSGGGGNAGCIGCVCVNGSKGSGYTSLPNPEGDNFDIDFVAHEMGHQFGGNHTFTTGNEGSNVHMEPGSGSTIMGYAGITGATDVQAHSDAYFHAVTIQQVTNYVKSTSCQTNTNTGNAVPTANAGSDYVVPKGTPLILNGSGSDTDGADVLTYCWEQFDENDSATTYPSPTATTGVAFRSYSPTQDTKRFLPIFSVVRTGATSWQWESIPTVARTLNFRLTVRDNRAGGGNNNKDDMAVTVSSFSGPFVVTSHSVSETWNTGETKTITWDVAGTTTGGINAMNVDIFIVDNSGTVLATLVTATGNDGSQDITVPNITVDSARVMVKASNNIFYAINSAVLGINAVPPTCTDPCPSTGNTSFQTSTTLVNFNTINNVTGKAGAYADYTSQSTTVAKNTAYDLTVNANTDGNYTVKTKVWIDWNKDCVFNATDEEYDLGEAVNVADGATTNSPLTITVPASATVGSTIMRVSTKYSSYAGSCDTGFDGEVEDYTIVVTETAAINDINNFDGFSLSPNPNNGNFSIALKSNNANDITVKVFDVIGRQVFNRSYDNNQSVFNKEIRLNNVLSGIYLVNITDGEHFNTEKIIIK